MEENGTIGLTLRQLVLEIREDVKRLDAKIDQIDRTGSIGTREELQDHESRLRRTERWVYGIPVAALVGLGGLVTALFTNQPL